MEVWIEDDTMYILFLHTGDYVTVAEDDNITMITAMLGVSRSKLERSYWRGYMPDGILNAVEEV